MSSILDTLSHEEAKVLEDLYLSLHGAALKFAIVQQDISWFFAKDLPKKFEQEIKDYIYPLEDLLSKLDRWADRNYTVCGLPSSASEVNDAILLTLEARGRMKDFLQFYYTKILQHPLFYMLQNKGQVILDAMKELQTTLALLTPIEQEICQND